MSRKRKSMKKIKEALRMHYVQGFSQRVISVSVRLGKTTVQEYISRARKAGIDWEKIKDLGDDEISGILFPEGGETVDLKPLPDWSYVNHELRKRSVTLQLLWDEYFQNNPDGYRYSRFCDLYQRFEKTLDLSMRQTHKAGDKIFVDYAGQTMPVIDPQTGEIRDAQIFVAVLGASNYSYCEATWTQTLPDWIGSHVRAFKFFGGVSRIVVPDNLKSGIKSAFYYDPEINPTYQRLAEHFHTAIVPARVYKPRDKAKVEKGVQVVERWILACLRNRRFFSLPELNEAISELLDRLNQRPFKKIQGSRKSLFDSLDKPALNPLPQHPFEYAEWTKARVNIDYHVELGSHYYSVPYQFVREAVWILASKSTVEIYHKGKRIAVHPRSQMKGKPTTLPEHMPSTHRFYAEWTPARMINWAQTLGNFVAQVVEKIMESKDHPEQGFRASLGVMRMGERFGKERLQAACQRALILGFPTYRSIRSILETGQDQRPLPEKMNESPVQKHFNLRGPDYYRDEEGEEHVITAEH